METTRPVPKCSPARPWDMEAILVVADAGLALEPMLGLCRRLGFAIAHHPNDPTAVQVSLALPPPCDSRERGT